MTVYKVLKIYSSSDDSCRHEVYPYSLGRHNIFKRYMYPFYLFKTVAIKKANRLNKQLGTMKP